MNFNDFAFEDDIELVRGSRGWDTENAQEVVFVEWADEDNMDMVIVEDEHGNKYETYPEEIEWYQE